MPDLTKIKKEDYKVLLGPQIKDATPPEDVTTGLMPDPTFRTIFIGVGGTGVQTLNYIKGAVKKRMHPSWTSHMKFLGVDASWSELNNAQHLSATQEGVMITRKHVTERMQNKATYPAATRRFMLEGPDGDNIVLGDLGTDGAARTRLIGKVKVHDQESGQPGADQDIVSKLRNMASTMPLPAAPNASYEVYIIGSGSGGTGSGTFLELPALVHHALGANPHHIYGILYLPDTLTGLDPDHQAELMANGYATLKELNYFQGMWMRPGYDEVWTYNDPANPELTIRATGSNGLFDIAYLIGSPGHGGEEARDVARETIAEFLLSLLVKASPAPGAQPFVSSAFLSNAIAVTAMNAKNTNPGNPNQEAEGSQHDFPKAFASIGFARAAAPKEMIRAYEVKTMCRRAGLKPMEDNALIGFAADEVHLLPFRGPNQLDNATTGTTSAEEILREVGRIHGTINNGNFSFVEWIMGRGQTLEDVTWQDIRKGQYEGAAVTAKYNAWVSRQTDQKSQEELKRAIDQLFLAYKGEVLAYVQKNGPFAFVNLYRGTFTPVNGSAGIGIGAMLQNLVNGKTLKGQRVDVLTVDAATAEVMEAKKRIADFDKLIDLRGERTRLKTQWVTATENLVKARINEKRREVVLGPNGYLQQYFVMQAAKLTDQLEAFGQILADLTDIYDAYGSSMDNAAAFQQATDLRTEVNLAAVNATSYASLKRQADDSIQGVTGRQFRDALVQDFFDNPNEWLTVPEDRIRTSDAGERQLADPDSPIPAREHFDQLVKAHIPMNISVQVSDLLNVGTDGNMQTMVDNLVQELVNKSQIRFDGTPDQNSVHRYIMYPSALQADAAFMTALNAACTAQGNIGRFASEDAESIKLYQQATCMEVYRINSLEGWERQYETRFNDATAQALLHGKSPDVTRVVDNVGSVTYLEGQRWVDYPSIVNYGRDPKLPDNNGWVKREGQNRKKLHEQIQRAKELGVLFSEKIADNAWVIKRVFLDRQHEWIELGPHNMEPDPATELFPQGRELVQVVANANNIPLNAFTKVVRLEHGGLFSTPAVNEEYAWAYAERVLRAHHPMMREVLYTMEAYFERWNASVAQWNQEVLTRRRPAMMVQMMRANLFYRDGNGAWRWRRADGTEKLVANYTDAARRFIQNPEKRYIENGLMSYYLFQYLDQLLPGDLLVQESQRALDLIQEWLLQGEMKSLEDGAENAKIVEQEWTALQNLGAQDSQHLTRAFVRDMGQIEASEDKLKEIVRFYERATQE